MSEPVAAAPPVVPSVAKIKKPRAAAYIFASCMLALTQGIAMNLVTVNIPQLQGQLDLTTNETTWLTAAYMAPNVSLGLAMLKVRDVIGLRRFAEISIFIFIGAAMANLWISNLESALMTRFFSGIAAAPLTSLAMLYMMEAFPPDKKVRLAPPLSLLNTTLGAPVARLISPHLMEMDGIYGIMMMDLGMGLMAAALVLFLPLANQPPRTTPIVTMDVFSYLALATGLGSIAVVLVLGRLYWWLDAPWIGATLAFGLAMLTIAALIELNRKSPMFDLAWIFSPAILRFAAIMLIFRMVVSEQFTGTMMLQAQGMQNQQMAGLNWVILLASIAGGAVLCDGHEARRFQALIPYSPCRAGLAGRGRMAGQLFDQPDAARSNAAQPRHDRLCYDHVPAPCHGGRVDGGLEARVKLYP